MQTELRSNWRVTRADQACEFLLEDPRFKSWYDATESRQLVIFGDVGHGKSVAMAFLAEMLSHKNNHRLPSPVLCQYYCRDHETGKPTSVLSALTYLLLTKLKGLQKPFHERYKQQAQELGLEPSLDIIAMEDMLQNMLEMIDRPVIFVIDGLDECDRDSRQRLLKFLKHVSEKTSRLKIILSCRPHEDIMKRLDGVTKIQLNSGPKRDRIIVEKALEALDYLSPEILELLRENLSQRAQGSAIWTKMTIELIQLLSYSTKSSIESFLEELPLPGQLSDVYTSILLQTTGGNQQNWQLAITALNIVAASRRALSILELAWAVAMGLAPGVNTLEALAKKVQHERVMRLIYPFIASPDYDQLRKHQLRLTHHSVKEWLSEQPDSKESGSKVIHQTNYAPKHIESFMLDICVKYLLLDEIGQIELFSEEQAALGELPQLRSAASDDNLPREYDPNCTWEYWEEDMARFDPVDRGLGELFVYASCHWVDHFGCVPAEYLPSLSSIENLCQAGSTRLRNWILQNSRPTCTMLPRFEFESSLYDPLSITSMYGSESALCEMLQKSNFDECMFLPETAMRAVDQTLLWGNVSRVKIFFLNDRTSAQVQNLEFFRLVIKRWRRYRSLTNRWYEGRQDWNLVFDLVDNVSSKMIGGHWGKELLSLAASEGCVPIVQRLLTSAKTDEQLREELFRQTELEGKQPNFEDLTHQLISDAVLGNHVDISRP